MKADKNNDFDSMLHEMFKSEPVNVPPGFSAKAVKLIAAKPAGNWWNLALRIITVVSCLLLGCVLFLIPNSFQTFVSGIPEHLHAPNLRFGELWTTGKIKLILVLILIGLFFSLDRYFAES
jgi:hypothetical protein